MEHSPVSNADPAAISRQIAEHCARLKSQLSADLDDLRRWGDDALQTSAANAGSAALSKLLTNVDELLGNVAGEGDGELKRDEH